jgi:hypothetical protein
MSHLFPLQFCPSCFHLSTSTGRTCKNVIKSGDNLYFYNKHCRNNTCISGVSVISTLNPWLATLVFISFRVLSDDDCLRSKYVVHSCTGHKHGILMLSVSRLMCYGAQLIPVVTSAQFENKVHQSLENENSDTVHFCSVLLYIRNSTAVFYASQASSARPSQDITVIITIKMA